MHVCNMDGPNGAILGPPVSRTCSSWASAALSERVAKAIARRLCPNRMVIRVPTRIESTPAEGHANVYEREATAKSAPTPLALETCPLSSTCAPIVGSRNAYAVFATVAVAAMSKTCFSRARLRMTAMGVRRIGVPLGSLLAPSPLPSASRGEKLDASRSGVHTKIA